MTDHFDQLNQPILETLKDVKILAEKRIKYLVFGSILCAACKGEFYRSIEDVDLLCDLKDQNKIIKIFENLGYDSKIIKPKFRLGFYWLDLRNKKNPRKYVAIVFGRFEKKGGWRFPLNHRLSLYIPNLGIEPTKYTLKGVDFIGFPVESVYIPLKLMPILYDDPKRKYDLSCIENKVDMKIVKRIYQNGLGIHFKNRLVLTVEFFKKIAFIRKLFTGKDYSF